jgi:hypothetical protein
MQNPDGMHARSTADTNMIVLLYSNLNINLLIYSFVYSFVHSFIHLKPQKAVSDFAQDSDLYFHGSLHAEAQAEFETALFVVGGDVVGCVLSKTNKKTAPLPSSKRHKKQCPPPTHTHPSPPIRQHQHHDRHRCACRALTSVATVQPPIWRTAQKCSKLGLTADWKGACSQSR